MNDLVSSHDTKKRKERPDCFYGRGAKYVEIPPTILKAIQDMEGLKTRELGE